MCYSESVTTARPLNDLFPGASVRELLASTSPGWNCFNPSIAFSPDEGFKIIIRSSNYRLDQYGQYNVSDPEGTIRTRNFIGTLDSELDLVDLHPIRSTGWGPVQFPPVRGLEDARLYWQQDHWQVYGTLREHRVDGLCTIAEATLEHDTLVSPRLLPHPIEGRPEKNWMAFPEGYVYSCQPPQIIRHGLLCSEMPSIKGEAAEFRGGGPLIPCSIDDDFLISIVHEVDWETGHRRYFHRFVVFDADGVTLGFTDPFFFLFDRLLTDVPMIEYAAGMTQHKSDYVVSFGFQDSRAMLARVPVAEVHKMIGSARL